jgi:tRNA-modifying protein YgfZ
MTATTDFRADYAAATEGVALLDRSERGKLALTGADAKEFLQGQVTQDVNGLSAGHGAYAAFLTPKGKMLGDLRVLDTGPPTEQLLLDTERVALQPLFNMIRRYSVGYAVQLHKRTLECGLISLVGPLADELVARFGSPPGDAEHDHVELEIGAIPVRAIRTDLGLDLLLAADGLGSVRAALLDGGGVEVRADVAECVRIEHGRPRYGIDLDESVIPQEAGLNERAVSFTKGCYVGQETVARLFYRGKPNRELRGLTAAESLPLGIELTLAGRVVGTVTSTADSPRLGPIALAIVRREAPVGAVVGAGDHEALVAELPFAEQQAPPVPASG